MNPSNNREESLLDRLFDENDNGTIILLSEHGEEIAFEQIAVIPIEGRTFAILQPVELLDGMDDDEALVFEAVDDEKGGHLTVVTDDATIDAVFSVYEDLLDSLDDGEEETE